MKRGTAGNPAKITKKNIVKYLVEAEKLLDEQNFPEPRWMRIPKWLEPILFPRSLFIKNLTLQIKKMSESGLRPEEIAQKIEIESQGMKIGHIENFTLYESNKL